MPTAKPKTRGSDPADCPPGDSAEVGGITLERLNEIAKDIAELEKPVREYGQLERAWKGLASKEARVGLSDSEQKDMARIERRMDQLKTIVDANKAAIKALQAEAAAATQEIRARANRAKKGSRTGLAMQAVSASSPAPIRTAKGLKAVRDCEAWYRAAYAAGDEQTRSEIKSLFDQYTTVAKDPRKELSTHEYRMLVREQEGMGLKERGQGICFKMLDQYAMMSPKEKVQIGGIPNVVGCTPEGVRAWEARNAEIIAQKTQEAFERQQEMEKARQELQDLRMTCYPIPDWVSDRILNHPQKAVAVHLGMRTSLPVPFTRDEVIQSVRDVVGQGGSSVPGQCAPVDPTSVHIAKHVARVLEHWFGSFGWVRVQEREGSGWSEVHLWDAVDKLHNDPFTRGFTPRRESYVTPLELGPYFSTTFDSEQRVAAMPSWLRVFGRPVLGPAAALAEQLVADGELSSEDRAQLEALLERLRSGEQVQSEAPVESYGPERAIVRRPEL